MRSSGYAPRRGRSWSTSRRRTVRVRRAKTAAATNVDSSRLYFKAHAAGSVSANQLMTGMQINPLLNIIYNPNFQQMMSVHQSVRFSGLTCKVYLDHIHYDGFDGDKQFTMYTGMNRNSIIDRTTLVQTLDTQYAVGMNTRPIWYAPFPSGSNRGGGLFDFQSFPSTHSRTANVNAQNVVSYERGSPRNMREKTTFYNCSDLISAYIDLNKGAPAIDALLDCADAYYPSLLVQICNHETTSGFLSADLHIEITAYCTFRGSGVNHRMTFIGEGPGPEPTVVTMDNVGYIGFFEDKVKNAVVDEELVLDYRTVGYIMESLIPGVIRGKEHPEAKFGGEIGDLFQVMCASNGWQYLAEHPVSHFKSGMYGINPFLKMSQHPYKGNGVSQGRICVSGKWMNEYRVEVAANDGGLQVLKEEPQDGNSIITTDLAKFTNYVKNTNSVVVDVEHLPEDGTKEFTQVFSTINGMDEDGDNDPILNGTVSITANNGRFTTFQANDEDLLAYNETHSGPEAVCVDGYIDFGDDATVTNTSGLSSLVN